MASKKKYQKPEIKAVKLTPEEAVLAGCKTGAGGNGTGAGLKCTRAGGCTANAPGS